MSPLFLWSLILASGKRPPQEKPHVLLIVADDLGWNDVGWNNPEMLTPNMNVLAREGVIFNSSYALSVCTPSRAALLSGRYPYKMGLQHGVLKANKPVGLPLNIKLLPQELKNLGYATHIIGKWHLGFCRWEYTPTFRGFDTFFGFLGGSQDHFTHRSGKEKGYDFWYNTKPLKQVKGLYSSELYAQRALKIIKTHEKTQPLFLYLPFQAPHSPLQVPDRYLNRFKHVVNRERRKYSAMVSAMDDAIGRVIHELAKKGILHNTLVIFTSDNGGSVLHGGNNWPLRGGKSTLWEGGNRVPTFVWGGMLRKRAYVNNEIVHITDWFPTILEAAGAAPSGAIDGISQWRSLVEAAPSNRTEMVYGINDFSGKAAIRVGKYKLIEGSPGKYNNWYPPPRDRFKIRSSRRHTPRHLQLTQLFDLDDDPEERRDLSNKFPFIVDKLEQRLREYKKELKPTRRSAKLRKAHPKHYGGYWFPGWC